MNTILVQNNYLEFERRKKGFYTYFQFHLFCLFVFKSHLTQCKGRAI